MGVVVVVDVQRPQFLEPVPKEVCQVNVVDHREDIDEPVRFPAALVGDRTRSVVVPGPLYEDAASYQTTPLLSVWGFETVSPLASA